MFQNLGLWVCRVFGLKVITRSQMDDLLFAGFRINTATLLKSVARERKNLSKRVSKNNHKVEVKLTEIDDLKIDTAEATVRNARLAEVEKQLQ